jgi:hypothetical protein
LAKAASDRGSSGETPARRKVERGRNADREGSMKKVIASLQAGDRLEVALAKANRQLSTYHNWRQRHKWFAEACDKAREVEDARPYEPITMDFPEFAEKYLDQPLPRHQQRIAEVIRGETPTDLTQNMKLIWSGEDSANTRIIVNLPPDHAKSTTWSVNWVTYQIHKNPNIRIVIISQTEALAKQFVLAVQRYLIDPYFEKLRTLDPPGGWKDDELPWRANFMYVRGRTSADPNPTLQALGMGQQIYGRRCDILIGDDVETLANVNGYEGHGATLSREADSRLRPAGEWGEEDEGGLLLILGTRVGPVDVYSYLRDNAKDVNEEPGFTYFAQPAILEGEFLGKDHWDVLWPERMSAKVIARRRAGYADVRQFQLIYQQSDIDDKAPFPAACVDASVERGRFPGVLDPDNPACPDRGMMGMRIVGGVDPATSGGTAMVVMAADKSTMKRYVLDVFYERGVHADKLISKMKELTERFGVQEWRVETNAFQKFLVQLEALRSYMNQRGVLLEPHMTNKETKWDEDWGVSTLIPLFKSCGEQTEKERYVPADKKAPGTYLITLPSPRNEGVSALIKQLKIWEPGIRKTVPVDTVMALWFAEIAAREYLLGRRHRIGGKKKAKFASKYMQNLGRKIGRKDWEDQQYAYGVWGSDL